MIGKLTKVSDALSARCRTALAGHRPSRFIHCGGIFDTNLFIFRNVTQTMRWTPAFGHQGRFLSLLSGEGWVGLCWPSHCVESGKLRGFGGGAPILFLLRARPRLLGGSARARSAGSLSFDLL